MVLCGKVVHANVLDDKVVDGKVSDGFGKKLEETEVSTFIIADVFSLVFSLFSPSIKFCKFYKF